MEVIDVCHVVNGYTLWLVLLWIASAIISRRVASVRFWQRMNASTRSAMCRVINPAVHLTDEL